MIESKLRKTVVAALMLTIGILLPFVTSHGTLLLPGKIFLPMHIPVLLCGYFCGPFYGGLCGFLLPYLNSFVTGMPTLYPSAVIMSFELMTYGAMSSVVFRLFGNRKNYAAIYSSLVVSLISGRVVYGIAASVLLFVTPGMKGVSAIAATISGIPGIVIQLIIIPQILRLLLPADNIKARATAMVKNGEATCVVVRDNKIISKASARGISHIIDLYDNGILKDSFVADSIVGKAAAMIFALAGVKECYGKTVSRSAASYLAKNNITITCGETTQYIENRSGDGMCPMEETVKDVYNSKEALDLLRKKVRELRTKGNVEK